MECLKQVNTFTRARHFWKPPLNLEGMPMFSFSVEQFAKSAVMSSLMIGCLSLWVMVLDMSQSVM